MHFLFKEVRPLTHISVNDYKKEFIKIFMLKCQKTHVSVLMHFIDKMAHLFFFKMEVLKSKEKVLIHQHSFLLMQIVITKALGKENLVHGGIHFTAKLYLKEFFLNNTKKYSLVV